MRCPVLSALSCAVLLLGCSASGPLSRESAPLRTGEVVYSTEARIYTYVQARDPAGKDFWFITTLCEIIPRDRVEILEGRHYPMVDSVSLGRALPDFYVATRLTINGESSPGLAAHDLPPGCSDLKWKTPRPPE